VIDDIDWYLDDVVVPGRTTREGRAARWRRLWREAVDAAAAPSLTRLAVALAREKGLVLTRADALSAGLTPADIRRLVRRGTWTAPRRNVLCVVPSAADAFPDVPHGNGPEARASAVALVRPGHTISHENAAAIHGLPLLSDPSRPRLTVGVGNGGGQTDALIHAAGLWPEEIETWFGAPVTTPARTVVDVARNCGIKAGLVMADAALADNLASAGDLGAAVERATHWPGIRAARRAVELASPFAESPLESLSRLLIIDAGLPVPGLQKWIKTHRGWYRVDGLWPDRAVILEVDGLKKYRDDDGALAEEKLRQEALERAGYRVVRVTWDDVVHHPELTVFRIADALRQGGRLCFGIG
jgi:hypothetical protein